MVKCVVCFLCFGIKAWEQELGEIAGRDTQERFLFGDSFLFDHITCDVDRCRTCPFAGTGLEHEQLALLDGELDVLHINIVIFERFLDQEVP